ncbi:MAG: NAD(P)/FAD-dependent oxidoreductase [Betaproteobacteria bacterium]|nr:NAD(P)/FAD-dependent oxidoreductase [Betaproteobacteria bacterium]MDH3435413.1 NAD(P)/FAD-dependent oxidoreductase [Betaproteobacteria bacterium]
MDFDVIVLGAGAAGMMCAAVAGRRGRRVLLVEHAAPLGEKIRISGGGRCNFTNLHSRPEAFLSRNPHFCRSALARYTPHDFTTLVERHGIRYHEKTLGQLFCDDSAVQIITMLRGECDVAGAHWAMPVKVKRVARYEGGDAPGFEVATTQGSFRARAMVVATGGLSIPKIGATPLGYRIAEQFGLPVVTPKPALVPLAAPPEWLAQFGDLSGASFDAIASCAEAPRGSEWPPFHEAALITHRGLSGPAILQVSSYWQLGGGRGPVVLDLLPGRDAGAWLAKHRRDHQVLGALLAEFLPRRFAQSFAEAHGWTQPLAQLSNAVLETVAQTLKGWRILPSGTLGYAKAEVTLGGVDTDALSQQTLESRSVPGLYFIGEVVDVTGWLGGYNFQWAWSSGHAAGTAV